MIITRLFFENDIETTLGSFMSVDNKGCEWLDFNKIIPMPENLCAWPDSNKGLGDNYTERLIVHWNEQELWRNKNWGESLYDGSSKYDYHFSANMIPIEVCAIPFPVISQLARLINQKIRITYREEYYGFWGEALFASDGSYKDRMYENRYSRHGTPKELDDELGISESLNDPSTWHETPEP